MLSSATVILQSVACKDPILPQQDKVNYARLRNTHLEYHGKEKKRKAKEGKDTKRVKRPRTTEAQRAVARTLVKEGYTQSEAARGPKCRKHLQ